MGRVRVDVLRVGSGTGTKSTGTAIPVFTRKERHFSRCWSYIECFFYFFLTRPILANDTRHIVFKKLYEYYKFLSQKPLESLAQQRYDGDVQQLADHINKFFQQVAADLCPLPDCHNVATRVYAE